MADYRVSAFYTVEGVGKTGITVTVDVYRANGTKVVSDGNATAIGGGLFGYTHSDATESDYFAVFKTSDATVDAKQIPAMMSREQANITVIDGLADAIKAKTDNLPSSPAAVGSQMTLADSAITAAKIANSAITADKIASNAITAAKIGSNTITSGKIASGAITDAKIATDAFSAAKFKADAVTKIQNGLAKATDIPSASDIATAVWSAVTRTLTALPTMAADWITALGIKSDAVTKIQSGLAKTTELPTDYATETNATANKNAIELAITNKPVTPATDLTGIAKTSDLTGLAEKTDLSGLALEATLTAMKGAGWSSETLKALRDAITAVQADLDNPSQYKADVSELAKPGDAMTLTSAYDAAKAAASQSSVNAIPTNPLLATDYTAPDNAGITAIKNKTDNLPLVPAAKGDIPSVSDIATAVWGAVTRTLTALPTMAADWITALGIKPDAVTKIQSGLAKTSELPTGYATETNATANKNAIELAITNKPVTPATDLTGIARTSDLTGLAEKTDLSGLALEATLATMKGAGWSNETLVALMDAIKNSGGGGGGHSAQEVWEYASRTLTSIDAPANMAEESTLIAIDTLIKAIKAQTDQLVFTLPGRVDANANIDTSELINNILAANVEGGISLKETLRIVLAFASGVSEGGGGTTIKYKDLTGLADRIIWTVNKSGDRLTSEIDGSDIT